MTEHDPIEAALTALLRTIVDADVDADTPLADLGMGSLALTRLRVEVKRRWGADFEARRLAGFSNARELAVAVTSSAAGPQSAEETRTPPDTAAPEAPTSSGAAPSDGEALPLTDLQQAYLLGRDPSITPDPVGCVVTRAFTVAGLDADRLRDAWRRVVRAHPALRLDLRPDGTQTVRPETPEPVLDTDLGPFAPGAWPLWRIGASGDTARLTFDASIMDGHGLERVLREWHRCYEDERHEPTENPAALGTCLNALAARGPDQDAALAFWRERLRDAPDGPAVLPPRTPARHVTLETLVPAAAWQAIERAAADWDASPSGVLLAAFADALRARRLAEDFAITVTTSERLRLPLELADTVGPFTSTAVIPLPDAHADRADAARAVSADLMAALEHNAVSGTRALRAADRTPAVPPVVFTSLLETVAERPEGFAAAVTDRSCRTAGVALDCQVWEEAGGLRVHWDADESRFPTGALAEYWAAFRNALSHFADEDEPGGEPNALQQSYIVARAVEARSDWDGCQVHLAFDVPLDPDEPCATDRLAAAWDRMTAHYPHLRTYVDARGTLRRRAPGPAAVPEARFEDREAADAHRALIGDQLTGRAFRSPFRLPWDLRVVTDPERTTVHLTLDLIVLDGPSIHRLTRLLMRLYADPAAPLALGEPAEAPASGKTKAEARAHWRTRVADLLPGPSVPARGARRRLTRRLDGFDAFAANAADLGAPADALLAACFAAAVAPIHGADFSFAWVRWTRAAAALRPGEHTALSWLTWTGGDLAAAAAEFGRIGAADEAADAWEGLKEYRREAMRRRADGTFAHPFVYTGLLDLRDAPLPDGVRRGPWLTCTPEVAIDCVSLVDGDGLDLYWDVAESGVDAEVVERAFDRYAEAVEHWTRPEPRVERRAAERSAEAKGRTARPAAERAETTAATALPGAEAPAAPPATPRIEPVHLAIERRAAERPDAEAFRWNGGSMTFAEYDRRANGVAALLRANGTAVGDAVIVSVPRGPHLPVAILGVLKAGAHYVPVEPGTPAARVVTMARLTGAELALVAGDPPFPLRTADIGRAAPTADRPEIPLAADAAAYVVFTSGSTGEPKGVRVSHRTVAKLFDWCVEAFDFTTADLGLNVTSPGFDLSVFDLLGLPGYGAAVYVADDDERRDPRLLAELLVSEGITFWNSAPTIMQQCADWFGRTEGEDRLRLVFLSGDFTPLSLPDRIKERFTDATVVNLGGATEATVWSNYHVVGAIDPDWRSIPYGRPMPHARYLVLDADGAPVPDDVEGELYIGGDCLADGYAGREDLTAERFVPDPFDADPAARLYRTGDLVLRRPDGVFFITGRVDDQIKVRGFRVEPGEIAHRLREHPAVSEAVVLAPRDGTGDRRLTAFIIPAAGSETPSTAELRAFAEETLPDYMVPTRWRFTDAFPSTANGKLDRQALLEDRPPAAPAPPDPGHRDAVAAVFAELLELDDFADGEDLWDLGATSFTMIRASALIRERTGKVVSVAVLLGNPTVAAIAAALDGPSEGEPEPPAPAACAPAASDASAEADAVPGSAVPDSADSGSVVSTRTVPDAAAPAPPPAAPVERIALHRSVFRGAAIANRATQREFADRRLRLAELAALLDLAREHDVDGSPRRRYPSAGSTFPIRVYLRVRPGAVEGLDGGLYCHDPVDHELHRLDPDARIDPRRHAVVNRPAAERAAAEILLYAHLPAIEPRYQHHARDFALLEAGYLGQTLMEAQTATGVGLCPFGTVRTDPGDEAGIGDGDVFVHGLLAGPRLPHAASAPAAEPIAVIGMAGRYPGAADLESFWDNLISGRDGVAGAPPERGGSAVPGAFLDGVHEFDPLFFAVPPVEAALMDPQERLFLQTAWHAVENAGYTPERLRESTDRRVGVFAASMYNDYPYLGPADAATGSAFAGIANRVSYFLDLTGPSMTVDTMCSGSLTAVHLAAAALRAGECASALAGGVNLTLHPQKYTQLRERGMLAAGGRCRSFSADADGFVPGEGVGAVLLKPLARARADGDRVLAVIEGSAIRHGGRTTGYTVPDSGSQRELIEAAMREAGVSAADIGYVETHGTGTALGDPVEYEGLDAAYAADAPSGTVPFGSLKSFIGHLEGAAGVAALTKAVLQMRHRALPPSLHADRLNPAIDWDRGVLRLQREAADWPERPLRTAVSGYGAGGAGAHLIVSGPEDSDAEPRSEAPGAAQAPGGLLQSVTAYGPGESGAGPLSAPPLPGTPFRDATDPGSEESGTVPAATPNPVGPFPGATTHSPDPVAPEPTASHTIVLAARNDDRLRTYCRRLADWLRRHPGARLADVAYTLASREPFAARIAFTAVSAADLTAQFARFAAGEGAARSDLAPAVRAWADGGPTLSAAALAPGGRLIDLPGYPFARMECRAPGLALDLSPGAALRPEPTAPLPEVAAYTTAMAPVSGPPREHRTHRTLCLARVDQRDLVARLRATPAFGNIETRWERVDFDTAVPLHVPAGIDGWLDLCALDRPADTAPEGTGSDSVALGSAASDNAASISAAPDSAVFDSAVPGSAVSDSAVFGGAVSDSTALDSTDAVRRDALLRALPGTGPLRVVQAVSGLLEPGGDRRRPDGLLVHGLVRGLGREYPHLDATVLDLDDGDPAAAIAAQWTRRTPGEVAIRSGRAFAPTAVPVALPSAPARTVTADGVYLLTGGVRGLGALAARRLAALGARRLVLTGRRPLPSRIDWGRTDLDPAANEAIATVRDLEAQGVAIETWTGDLADRSAVAALLDRVRDRWGPVTGIVHCAGVFPRVARPHEYTAAEWDDAHRGKVAGWTVLSDLTAADPLRFAVLFSSAAVDPEVGAGRAPYASANACLDRFAEAERGRGRPATAVRWPAWGASAVPGVPVIAVEDAEAVLDRVLTGEAPATLIIEPIGTRAAESLSAPREGEIDRPVPAGSAHGRDMAADAVLGSPTLEPDRPVPVDVALDPIAAHHDRATPSDAVSGPLAVLPERPASAAVVGAGTVARVIGGCLGLPPAELDPDAEFADLGVESVMAGRIVMALETALGRPVDPAVLLDHPTTAGVAAALGEPDRPAATVAVPSRPADPAASGPVVAAGAPPHRDAGDRSPVVGFGESDRSVGVGVAADPVAALAESGPVAPAGAPPHRDAEDRIAVVGFGLRFPGAPDHAAFARMLRSGASAVGPVPSSRWDVARLYDADGAPGRSVSRWGGFLDDIEHFDPDHFGLSEDEARRTDPAIRLTLEQAAVAFADAGLDPAALAGSRTGTVMGARLSGYSRRGGVDPAAGLGGDQNFVAAALAHRFDLRGPSYTVDSACSSALVALDLACRHLRDGSADLMLCGAVEVLLDEEPYLQFTAAGALSPRGRCAAFDAAADGFVPGEGVGVFVLKRLSDALAAGDPVRAVIDGVAVGNDGRTMGATTPNHRAQAAVVAEALERARRSPTELGLIEAHGTGTLIGDPIELRGLREALAERAPDAPPCPVGSVKSNIGHLLTAAGAAGLAKAIVAVEHGFVPPTLNCDAPNPRFDFASSPLVPASGGAQWGPGPRVAGVSAFGLGGTNAHAVVSAVEPAAAARRPRLPAPVFRKRRLWLEADRPAPVTSLLNLVFQ